MGSQIHPPQHGSRCDANSQRDTSSIGTCHFFNKHGFCKYAEACKYQHIEFENTAPAGICNFFASHGYCKRAEGCKYKHVQETALQNTRGADRAGYVFLCNNDTENECHELMMLGDSAKHFGTMKRTIGAETTLFLFNFGSKVLSGPFFAWGAPERDIDSNAYRGRFPAQVRLQSGLEWFRATLPAKIKAGPKSALEVTQLLSQLSCEATPEQGPRYSPSQTTDASAGYCFVCNSKTEDECHRFMIFGDHMTKLEMMQQSINENTVLFLFNFESRKLFGPYYADGAPGHNIVDSAWGGRFPAQVKVWYEDQDICEATVTGKMVSGPKTADEVQQMWSALGLYERDEQEEDEYQWKDLDGLHDEDDDNHGEKSPSQVSQQYQQNELQYYLDAQEDQSPSDTDLNFYTTASPSNVNLSPAPIPRRIETIVNLRPEVGAPAPGSETLSPVPKPRRIEPVFGSLPPPPPLKHPVSIPMYATQAAPNSECPWEPREGIIQRSLPAVKCPPSDSFQGRVDPCGSSNAGRQLEQVMADLTIPSKPGDSWAARISRSSHVEPTAQMHAPSERRAVEAGFVFLCNNQTEHECHDRALFGDQISKLKSIQKSINQNTVLFLFNFESRKLFGPYAADGAPAQNIVDSAWGGRFPAQVRIKSAGQPRSTTLSKRMATGHKSPAEVQQLLKLLGDATKSELPRGGWTPPAPLSLASQHQGGSPGENAIPAPQLPGKGAPGYVLLCSDQTEEECYQLGLIGDSERRLNQMQMVPLDG